MKVLLFVILIDMIIFTLSSIFLNDKTFPHDHNDTSHKYRYGYEWDRK
ncbi:MAG: hypothetical protein WBK95_06885 [Sulfurimonas sp.]|nr:hypothetical protein [Sulfurimonas sp.]MDD3060771.1 hypothetical protein [Sulfurimonas sp.]MDD5203419.1 hypothetical protein [Sulfurimonas sp.]